MEGIRTARSLEDRLRARLDRLEHKGRHRRLQRARGIDLSSNDYLGLSAHPTVRGALLDALDAGVPLGATGSRLLRGQTDWHAAMEDRLASFKNSEAALIFNSGYDANVGVISTLCGPGDVIFSDQLVHASTIDGIRASKARRVVFPHNDMSALATELARAPREQTKFIAVESLYSMEGDRAPLEDLAELSQRYRAHLIVDEAHATGVFGPTGAGYLETAGLTGLPLVTVHTCGKAWAGFGAFISCSHLVKEYLVNCCRRLIFTTALPPLALVQWHAVMDVMTEERWRAEKALTMAAALRDGLRGFLNTGRSDSQIVPVILGGDEVAVAAAERLQTAGFDIRAIRPPSVPRGTARLRIAVNAKLAERDLDRLIALCRKLAKELHP